MLHKFHDSDYEVPWDWKGESPPGEPLSKKVPEKRGIGRLSGTGLREMRASVRLRGQAYFFSMLGAFAGAWSVHPVKAVTSAHAEGLRPKSKTKQTHVFAEGQSAPPTRAHQCALTRTRGNLKHDMNGS